jgi:hypothetical protein
MGYLDSHHYNADSDMLQLSSLLPCLQESPEDTYGGAIAESTPKRSSL